MAVNQHDGMRMLAGTRGRSNTLGGGGSVGQVGGSDDVDYRATKKRVKYSSSGAKTKTVYSNVLLSQRT